MSRSILIHVRYLALPLLLFGCASPVSNTHQESVGSAAQPEADSSELESMDESSQQESIDPQSAPSIQDKPLTSRIAFSSMVDGVPQIFTMKPDGSDIVQITDDAGRKFHPDWSPDGRQLIYVANFGHGSPDAYTELYTINTDGRDKRLLPNTRDAHEPAWSPDGLNIAFDRNAEGNTDIYVVDTDGEHLARLTDHPSSDVNPDWSHDGAMLSFESERESEREFGSGLYVMNADGSDPRELIFTTELFCSSWSQEGSKLIFGAHRSEEGAGVPTTDLFTINPDGEELTRITHDDGPEAYPSMSPDGEQIVFMEDFRIYVINVDGTGERRLDARNLTDEDPAWSPWIQEPAAESEPLALPKTDRDS